MRGRAAALALAFLGGALECDLPSHVVVSLELDRGLVAAATVACWTRRAEADASPSELRPMGMSSLSHCASGLLKGQDGGLKGG